MPSDDNPATEPTLPSREDIRAAAKQLAPYLRTTPVVTVDRADLGIPGRAPLVLKLELVQHSGSFKARGAHLYLLGEAPPVGVVAASGGNFGVAVAYARRLGVPATVFVPATSARPSSNGCARSAPRWRSSPATTTTPWRPRVPTPAATGARFLPRSTSPR